MQVNESKIAFICFHLLFGIGTFQWVTADSNKKIPDPLSLVVYNLCSVLSPRATPPTPSLTRSMAIVIPRILNFGKKTQTL
jgi:hypothetical protein